MANINLENLQHQLVLAEQRLELADADQKDATAELIKLSKLRSKSRNSVSDAEYRKHSQIQINATQAKNNALEQVRNIRRMIAIASRRAAANATSASARRTRRSRSSSSSSSRSSRSRSSSRSSRSGSRSSSRNRGTRRNR